MPSALGVEVLPIPEGLRLGESWWSMPSTAMGKGDAARAASCMATPWSHRSAHPGEADVIVGGASGGDYSWAEIETVQRGPASPPSLDGHPGRRGGPRRPAGRGRLYFAFASSLDLVRAITRARGDFVGGVNAYLADHEVYRLEAAEWLDFGHLQTFFRSRLAVTTARSFNTVRMDGLTARKSSVDEAKMRAEARWLRNAPSDLQIYCGRMIETGVADGRGFYLTEYEYLPVLSELFVYGAVGRRPWLRILASCETFLAGSGRGAQGSTGSGDTGAAQAGRGQDLRPAGRLQARAGLRTVGIWSPPGELSYAGRALSIPAADGRNPGRSPPSILTSGRFDSVMHGDLCFSNILYDSPGPAHQSHRSRGGSMATGTASLYGDPRYDLAKLAHSIIGRYDQIIAGRCRVRRKRRPSRHRLRTPAGPGLAGRRPGGFQRRWPERRVAARCSAVTRRACSCPPRRCTPTGPTGNGL